MKIKKQNLKAITLIELLVSIGVIMATIGMVATFIKYQKPNIELASSSLALKNALQTARQLALTTQANHGVQFDIINNTYKIVKLGNPLTTVSITALPNSIIFKSIGSFSNNTVNFNAGGGAKEAGTIVLQNSFNNQKSLIISPSGYVSNQ